MVPYAIFFLSFFCPLMGLTCLLYHHSCLGAHEDCLERASCFHLWTESCSSHPQSCWCPQSSWWPSHMYSSHLCLFCNKSMRSLIGMDNWIDCPWGQRVWLPVLVSPECRGNTCGRWMGLTENWKLIPEKLMKWTAYHWWLCLAQITFFFFPAVRFLDAFRGFFSLKTISTSSRIQFSSTNIKMGRREGGREERKRKEQSQWKGLLSHLLSLKSSTDSELRHLVSMWRVATAHDCSVVSDSLWPHEL